MKLKSKLIATISTFCLVFVMMVVGIWALKSTSFELGGKINFNATGVNATISDGTLENGTHKTADDATTKLKTFKIKVGETQTEIDGNSAGWRDLDLLFDEDGEDVKITFSITNDNEDADKYLSVAVGVTQGTQKNATVSVSPTSASIAPTTSQEFVVTFHIENTDFDASLDGFKLDFTLTHVKYNPAESLTYTISKSNAIVRGVEDTTITSLIIPEKVIIEGTEYTVTGISDGAFTNCTSLKSITLPNSITTIGTKTLSYSWLEHITLGENFASLMPYTELGGYTGNLKSITVYATTPPPVLAPYGSIGIPTTSPLLLYVPGESLEEYRKVYPWNSGNIQLIAIEG